MILVIGAVAWFGHLAPLLFCRGVESRPPPGFGWRGWVGFVTMIVAAIAGTLLVEDVLRRDLHRVQSWHQIAGAFAGGFVVAGLGNIVTGRCSYGVSRGPLRRTLFHHFDHRRGSTLTGLVRLAVAAGLAAIALTIR